MSVDPGEVDAKLIELSDLLADQADENRRLAVRAAELVADHKAAVATNQLIVRADAAKHGERMTEAQVDAVVTERTMDAHRDRLVAEAEHESARDTMFALRARIDALRTVAASHREAVKG